MIIAQWVFDLFKTGKQPEFDLLASDASDNDIRMPLSADTLIELSAILAERADPELIRYSLIWAINNGRQSGVTHAISTLGLYSEIEWLKRKRSHNDNP